MPRLKQASKRNRTKQALPALGIVGISLTLAGGVSEGNAWNIAPSHEMTLHEEEISDVSLSTFWVFDKDSAETPRLQFAQFGCRGCRGCRGCGGCRGCRAFGGCGGGGCWHGGGSRPHGCGSSRGGCGGCRSGCGGEGSSLGGCGGGGGGCGGGGCGCGGGGCGGGAGGCGGGWGGGSGGGGGYGAPYRAPPPAPEVGNSEDSKDQTHPKAKKTVGDSEARPKAKTNSPGTQ